jgi:hypothetical protein
MTPFPCLFSSHRRIALIALTLAAAGSAMAAVPAISVKRLHNKGYILHWGDLPDDVDQVRLENRSLKPKNQPFLVSDTVPANRTGFFVYNLSPGQTLEWRATLLRDGQAETGTPFKVTTTKTLPPGYAQHLRAVSVRPDRVEIAWDDTVTKEKSYKIFRRDEYLETTTIEVDLPKDSANYVDSTVQPGKNYFYTIVAVGKNKALGDLTHELWVRTPAADALPDSPHITAQGVREEDAMRVSWSPDASGFVDGYSIQRKFRSYWLEVGRADLTSTSLLDTSSPAYAGTGLSEYRAVPFNVNGLAAEQFSGLGWPQHGPYPFGHSAWQEPVQVGRQFYLLDPGGKKIHRFDTPSETWLAPIELKIPYAAYRFTVAASGEIFVGSGSHLYRVNPSTGESVFLASNLGIGSLVAYQGRIYYCGRSTVLGIEPGPSDGTLIANAAVVTVKDLYDPRVIRRSGDELLISGSSTGSPYGTTLSTVRLTALEATNPYNVQVIGNSSRVFPAGGQKFLITGDGELTTLGDSTGGPIATLGLDKIRDTASLPNGGHAVLGLDSLHLYDRWWNLKQAIASEGGKSAVCEASNKVWSIHADPLTERGWSLASFPLPAAGDEAAFWTSPIPPDGLEESDDGTAVLVHRASGTWRSRAAGAPAFSAGVVSDRGMVDWEYDPQRKALFLLSSGGQVSRHGLSSPTPEWDRQLPTAATFMAYSGNLLEISHSHGLTVDGDQSNNQVNWMPYPLQSPRRPLFTTWDPVSNRLYHQPYVDELLVADRALGMNIGEPRGLKNEEFSGFLRISPDRSRAVFGGGFIATYPDFFPLLQLSINAKDAAWNGEVLLAGGTDSGGQHLLASFDGKGKVLKAFSLPGEAVHVAKDGDGWLVLHRIESGNGWRLIRGDATLSSFTLVGGSGGAMPQATTLADGAPQFPEWYEALVTIGDPDQNGLSAIQEYMLAKWEPYLENPPVQIVNYGGKDIFYVTRRTDYWLAPFRLAIEYSGDMVNWTEEIPTTHFDIQHGSHPGTALELESFYYTPKDSTTKAFFRVRFIGPSFAD